jgi:hypothetical protein
VLTTELQRTLAFVQTSSTRQYAALSAQLGSDSVAVTSACAG